MEEKPKSNLDKNVSLIDREKIQKQIEEGHRNWIDFLHNDVNNLSYWFPKIEKVEKYGIRIPKTSVIKVPDDLLDCFFCERDGDYEAIEEWVEHDIMSFLSDLQAPVFMKNGCFSNKFDFKNNCLIESIDNETVSRHICRLQNDSLMFDTGGNLEIVFREWVKPKDGTKTIYNGMPLRSEMRLFYDFDNHRYLYDVNYWDWDYCYDYISRNDHDKEVYSGEYVKISNSLEMTRKEKLPIIINALSHVTGLKGMWSVDFILEDGEVWLIDMAVAHRSAYWDESKIGKS